MRFILGLIAGLALGITLPSIAQNPCDQEPTWRIAPPRVGNPEDNRMPLACIVIDGTLRCQ